MPMELSFRLVLAIVVGIVIVLAILVVFWGTISQFMPWASSFGETTISSGTKTMVTTKCYIACNQYKDSIRAGATWQVSHDLNGDGQDETISCTDGTIVSWGNNNQPKKCGGVGCEKSCSCVDNTWYQVPKTC